MTWSEYLMCMHERLKQKPSIYDSDPIDDRAQKQEQPTSPPRFESRAQPPQIRRRR